MEEAGTELDGHGALPLEAPGCQQDTEAVMAAVREERR
jgi:hypothetical protein